MDGKHKTVGYTPQFLSRVYPLVPLIQGDAVTFPPRTDQTTLLPWPMETLSQVPMDHVTNAYMVELKNWMGGMGPPFLPQMQLPPWPPFA